MNLWLVSTCLPLCLPPDLGIILRQQLLLTLSVQQPSTLNSTSLAKSGYYLSLSWTLCTDRLTGNTTRRERWQAITGEVVVELVLVGFRLCSVSYVAEWWWIRFWDCNLQADLSTGGKLGKLFSNRTTLNLRNQMNSHVCNEKKTYNSLIHFHLVHIRLRLGLGGVHVFLPHRPKCVCQVRKSCQVVNVRYRSSRVAPSKWNKTKDTSRAMSKFCSV